MNHPSPLEVIFFAALEKGSPQERAAYLDQACTGDPDLRRRVEKMLAAQAQAGSFLEQPAHSPDVIIAEPPVSEGPGTVIGPYKLLEPIGEGGFGLVFLAEQSEPVRRKVALKVIKPGMDTRQVVARFEAERQALALMDHPHIARVFDGGATPSGRPYFVMELVQGVPLTEYCDQNHLTPRQRLELFLPVCQAVQHAHQKGIIHRDLKPSNVLIAHYDGRPVPKVIDFGIAKATGQQLTDKTLFTGIAQMIGTPLYMSPEQAGLGGLDIDTRSDIYSLGVLLYELLTGTTPFDKERLKQAGHDEWRRIIREEEPPPPSKRLSTLGQAAPTVSAQRQSEPKKLSALFRGELDWIVMKALEKDRSRRYQTADSFALDVQRYLNDEPVQACPPSAAYRLRKFLRRHKGPVLVAAAILVLLLAGIVGTTIGLVEAHIQKNEKAKALQDAIVQRERAEKAEQGAKRDRDEAIQAELDTAAFSDFLVNHVLAAARPEGRQGGLGIDVTVVRALETAEKKLDAIFAGRPLAEATARHGIGVTWRNLGKYEAAEPHLRRAVALREENLGPSHAATLQARNSLGVLLSGAGQHAEAVMILEEVMRLRKTSLGADHPQTLNTMSNLAAAYERAGRLTEAFELHEQTLNLQKATLGPTHNDTLHSLLRLASSYQAKKRPREAVALFEEVLQLRQSTLPPGHVDTLTTMELLARAYRDAARLTEAIRLLKQVHEERVKKFGPSHPDTLTTLHELAQAYLAAGQITEAIQMFEQMRDQKIKELGADHPSTLATLHSLAAAYLKAGRTDEAIRLFEQVHERRVKVLGPDHQRTVATLGYLAHAYLQAGWIDKALPLLERVREQWTKTLGPDHPYTLTVLHDIACAQEALGQVAEAIRLYEQVYQARANLLGPDHPQPLITLTNLGLAYAKVGRTHDAVRSLEQACELMRKKLGPTHSYTLDIMNNLATVLLKGGRPADAEAVIRESLAIREKIQPGEWRTFHTQYTLGAALQDQKKYSEAEPLLLQGYEGMKQREARIPAPARVVLTESLKRLVQLYEVWGKPDEAARWQRALEARRTTGSDKDR